MQDFSAPILQQPRLLLVLPVAIIAVTVVVANLVWFGARSAGVSPAAGGVIAIVTLLAGIAFAISSSRGPQGTVRVVADQLEVDGRWRAVKRVPLRDAEFRQLVWRRGGTTMLVTGVQLNVRARTGEGVTIGSWDAEMANVLIRSGTEATTVPPRATLSPAHYAQLMDVLGVAASREDAF